MPDQRDRIDSLSIIKRVIALLMMVASIGLFSASVGSVGPAAQTKPAGQSLQQTVVGEKCMQCHKLVVESFALDAHGKSAKFLKDSRAATCESCHGDGTKHNDTTKAEDIINPPRMTTAQANESCLQCHARDRTHNTWRGGKHDRNDMSCLSCHNEHHAKLLERMSASLTGKAEREIAEILNAKLPERMLASFTVEDTCLRCHTDKRKAMFQRSTHLFRTEHRAMKVTCVSCHDAHGGEGRKMLQARSVNDTCYQCHADKRGPMLWEHAPVQENCLTCHNPHGSNNVHLLTTRSHQLCQQCHVNLLPRHQTVAGFDVFTFNQGCVNCHSQIHGSNHPAGSTFTR